MELGMGSHGSNVFFKKPPFIFDDYQTYLSDLVEVHHGIRGLRSRLAESANCQPSYLTQVLKHEAHFSLDQLFGIATYFKLTKPEWEYLRELWLLGRAATPELRAECEARLEDLRDRYGGVVGAADTVTEEVDSSKYHLFGTSWHHGAIYVALEIPELRTVAQLSQRFELSPERVKEVLRELREMGIVEEKNLEWVMSSSNFYMDADSPIFQMYRTAWFMKGALDTNRRKSVPHSHSGASVTMSRARYLVVRKKMKEFVMGEVFLPSNPNEKKEIVAFIGFDLFEA